jgi:hypothetical protein
MSFLVLPSPFFEERPEALTIEELKLGLEGVDVLHSVGVLVYWHPQESRRASSGDTHHLLAPLASALPGLRRVPM